MQRICTMCNFLSKMCLKYAEYAKNKDQIRTTCKIMIYAKYMQNMQYICKMYAQHAKKYAKICKIYEKKKDPMCKICIKMKKYA